MPVYSHWREKNDWDGVSRRTSDPCILCDSCKEQQYLLKIVTVTLPKDAAIWVVTTRQTSATMILQFSRWPKETFVTREFWVSLRLGWILIRQRLSWQQQRRQRPPVPQRMILEWIDQDKLIVQFSLFYFVCAMTAPIRCWTSSWFPKYRPVRGAIALACGMGFKSSSNS